ncbi:hypothetical protein QQZ08_012094 [Neonectria magnoliae]|uniref:Aminoglycoside phosphotransferase domain-containing protein n=1 Tax=Neonectria magnoliae TaxID=2732573 RepID=A0ABR1H586_9HYPO
MPTLKPLPDVEGPKLECFADNLADHDVKFIKMAVGGCQSNVYQVEIDGKTYALKCFYNYTHTAPNGQLDPIYDMIEREIPDSDWDALLPYATPFNAECRAFGRLKEINREDLAVRAYGYTRLFMTEEMGKKMHAAYGPNRKNPPSHTSWKLPSPDHPIMAIVKDWLGYVHAEPYWKRHQRASKFFPMIHRNLLALHKSGIVVRDIEAQQYINGVLVDLGQAYTIPHIYDREFGKMPCWTFASLAAWDLLRFHHMVWDWNNTEWPETMHPRPRQSTFISRRDEEACDRLRPRVYRQRPYLPILNYDRVDVYVMPDMPPFDPSLFDWRKAANKGRTTTKRSSADESQTVQPTKTHKVVKRKVVKRKDAKRK